MTVSAIWWNVASDKMSYLSLFRVHTNVVAVNLVSLVTRHQDVSPGSRAAH